MHAMAETAGRNGAGEQGHGGGVGTLLVHAVGYTSKSCDPFAIGSCSWRWCVSGHVGPPGEPGPPACRLPNGLEQLREAVVPLEAQAKDRAIERAGSVRVGRGNERDQLAEHGLAAG